MKTTEIKNLLNKLLISSSIIWAALLLALSMLLGDSYATISTILICGYTTEFLLIQSTRKKIDAYLSNLSS